jgi:WD40 repeat protein
MWSGKLPVAHAKVLTLVFAPDGRTLYTGDSKGCVLAWDLVTHEHRVLLQRRRTAYGLRPVTNLMLAPDGSRLLSQEYTKVLDLLHPDGRVPLPVPIDLEWTAILPDGKRILSVEYPHWRMGFWSLKTGKRLKLPGELGKQVGIRRYEPLPDGNTLLAHHADQYRYVLWSLRTGKRLGELEPGGEAGSKWATAEDGSTFAFNPTRQLWVYDLTSRKISHQVKLKKNIDALAIHPNGKVLATAFTDAVVTFWDVGTAQQIRQFEWQAGRIHALTFSPDGLTCAAGTEGRVVVWDVGE